MPRISESDPEQQRFVVDDADGHDSSLVPARDVAGEERDRTAEGRDRVADRRDGAGDRRDGAGQERDGAGIVRDAAGAKRDHMGGERDAEGARRDQAGAERDLIAQQRDESAEQAEAWMGPAGAADARRRSAIARRDAASDRTRAAQDRGAGAGDRLQSEVDRDGASDDRDAGADDRRRSQLDRDSASGDREAGSDQRGLAGNDRDIARADRAASAHEREFLAHDDLTGAYLRGPGVLMLEHEMDRAKRTNQPLVLGFVDVDRLKAVNDSDGHAAGDRLLVRVATALRSKLRAYDLLIRYGGDEFLCVIAGLDSASAAPRLALANAELAAGPEPTSITFGLAEMRPSESLEQLVARADGALYGERRHDASRR